MKIDKSKFQPLIDDKMIRDVSISWSRFDRAYTYMFEIIYPENRIVVDYEGKSKLVFLGARHIESGRIMTPIDFRDLRGFFETAYPVDFWSTPRANAEGVVLYYDNGSMWKVKYEEYIRLHRLVTRVNAKTIWELLKDGKSTEELLERVPDEFFAWVCKTVKDLQEEFDLIEAICKQHYQIVSVLKTRKSQAVAIIKTTPKLSGIIFAMLDKKPYDEIIWKMIRPRADRPFKEEI